VAFRRACNYAITKYYQVPIGWLTSETTFENVQTIYSLMASSSTASLFSWGSLSYSSRKSCASSDPAASSAFCAAAYFCEGPVLLGLAAALKAIMCDSHGEVNSLGSCSVLPNLTPNG